MAPTSDDVYRVLQSIDARLKSIDETLIDVGEHFGVYSKDAATQAPTGQGAVPAVASDRDLDSQYGNPEVKAKDPRDWTGEPQKGNRFSECPPAYLDLVAERLDYFAEQNDEHAGDQQTPSEEIAELRKKAKYNRIDASRARGWAARLRAGWTPPAADTAFGAPASGEPLTDDAIPFAWLLPFALPALLAWHAVSLWT